MGYLANFMVYTLAMIGVIAVALLVFRNTNSFGGAGKSKYLKVIDTLTIAPRKTLYVVSTGREKFLIAGDVGNTTLISKLETSANEIMPAISETNEIGETRETNDFKLTMENLSKTKTSYMDRSNIGIRSSLLSQKNNSAYTSVMKSLASKMQGG